MISFLLIEHHVVLKVLSVLFFFFLTFLYFLEYHASEWKLNTETGKRERLCTYKVTVSAVFGQTTICSNEKQVRQYILFCLFF